MLDLDAYLRRIGLSDVGAPDLPLLRAVIAAHTAAIPFENLDIVLGRPVLLDIPSLEAKLVRSRRGGYCFEQNTLLAAALTGLGFTVEQRMARVVRAAPPGAITPRTHLFLRVALPEGAYLADAGFGNLTPTGPLLLGTDAAQATPHEAYRLIEAEGLLTQQVRLADKWEPTYRFEDRPTFPIDAEMANWFTSTKPGGKCTANGIAACPGEDMRTTLLNGTVTLRFLDGKLMRFESGDGAMLQCVLDEYFGIELPAADADTLSEAMRGFAERPGVAFE